jgi:hypothetical protein
MFTSKTPLAASDRHVITITQIFTFARMRTELGQCLTVGFCYGGNKPFTFHGRNVSE